MSRQMGLRHLFFQDEKLHEASSRRHAELPTAMLQLLTTRLK